jgi:hypothetical protein
MAGRIARAAGLLLGGLAAVPGAVAQGAPAPAPAPKPVPTLHAVFEEEVTETAEPGPAAKATLQAPPALSKVRHEVWLTAQAFAVSRSGLVVLYDFEKQRTFSWKEDGSMSVAHPLEAEVDFRASELRNRIGLAEMMKQFGKEEPAYDLFELETMLGMEKVRGGLRDRIGATDTGGVLAFTLDGAVRVRASGERRPLPEMFRASWARYVRYERRLHPGIADRLVMEPWIPGVLASRWTNVGKRFDSVLRCTLVEEAPGRMPVPPVPKAEADDPLAPVEALVATAKVPTREEAVAAAGELAKAGAPEDAVLGLLGWSMATGLDPSSEIRRLRSDAKTGPPIEAFLAGMGSPRSREEAEALMKWLESQARREYRGGYVLDILRANTMSGLGDVKGAVETIHGVLKAHPEVAGAWHDLGQVYRRDYDHWRGWRCFEAGLRLAPEHGLFQDVADLRKGLRTAFPEYFR